MKDRAGNILPLALQADFTIQASREFQSGFGLMDRSTQLFTLGQQMQQELGQFGDLIALLGRRSINGGLILRFSHHLMPQTGVLHLGDIAVDTEDGIHFVHHGPQFILETESFLQIHSRFTPSLI